MRSKILAVLISACIFSCSQEDLRATRTTSGRQVAPEKGSHEAKIDSIARHWGANSKWTDSLLFQPTSRWQETMKAGALFASGIMNHADSYFDRQERLNLVYFCAMPVFKLITSCNAGCQAKLPPYDRFSYSNVVVFSVDSIRPEYLYAGDVDISSDGTASYTAEGGGLSVVPVIYGKLIDVTRL